MIKRNKDQLEISEHFMAKLHSWLKGYYRYFGFPHRNKISTSVFFEDECNFCDQSLLELDVA